VYSHAVASAEGDGPGLSLQTGPSRRRQVGAQGANPTLRQRELGIRLRELRLGLELTVEEVGERLLCSATKISRLETGARRASLRDVRDLCQIYGVTDQVEADELMSLARQAREPGWWTQYDDLRLDPYIGLEQEAVAITSFSMYYVPPLLQTGDYARAIIRGIARKIDPRILEQRAEARLRRQQLLEKQSPPRYRALLDEAVLHRQVGGSAVMQAQLDKILKCAADEIVTVQVIPFSVGAHAAADSNFDLLEFRAGSLQGSVVYVEGLFSNFYQERPAEIERYREAIERLRDSALNAPDSVTLIAQLRGTHSA
jgi:transcriptional regulator with XRE-family HTH domain